MLSTKFNKYSYSLIILLTASFVVVCFAGYYTYQASSVQQELLHLQKMVDEIEINLHEETGATQSYLLFQNSELQGRISDCINDSETVIKQLRKTKWLGLESNFNLDQRLQQHHQLARELIDIADQKNNLINDFEILINRVDSLLDEKKIPHSILSNSYKMKLTYTLELKLAKISRQLGLFLKKGEDEILDQLDSYVDIYTKLLRKLKSQELTDEEIFWLEPLEQLVESKLRVITAISELTVKKNSSLKKLLVLSKDIENTLDDELQVWIEEKADIAALHLKRWFFSLLILTVILLYFLSCVSRMIYKTGRQISSDLDHVLTITECLAHDSDLVDSYLPPNNNEFKTISLALQKMQRKWREVSLSKHQVDQMLDQIGSIRFIIHESGHISHGSTALIDNMPSDCHSESLMLHDLFPGKIDYNWYKALIELNLILDLDLFLGTYDREKQVCLSGILLDDKTIIMFGSIISSPAKMVADRVDPFRKVSSGLILVDKSGIILAVNPAIEHQLDLKSHDLLGKELKTICAQQYFNVQLDIEKLEKILNSNVRTEVVINPNRLEKKNYASCHVFEISTPEGGGYAVILDDITQIRLSEEHTHQLAYFDVLTGLPNRTQMMEYLEKEIRTANRQKTVFAVLFLDMDNFKDVNDLYGHDQGDTLLATLAKRINNVSRETDFVSRLGGDEFCIITSTIEQKEGVGQLAKRILNVIKEPLLIGTKSYTPRASIGISLYPHDGVTTQELLKKSDMAMYESKQSTSHSMAFYQQAMTEKVHKRISLEAGIERALKEKQFDLYYQPQVSLLNGHITGLEALIRWHHPEHGLISPADFIPIAENSDLIIEIGRWVLETACLQTKSWLREGFNHITTAVNISSKHFELFTFVDEVKDVLARTGMPSGSLEIEITESVARNVKEHIGICKALSSLGIQIAIDDFGTGYSSFAILNELSVHSLKIDRLFIQKIEQNPQVATIVGSINNMGKELGLRIVIEGVETQEQIRLLSSLGCDLIQGYYYSRPRPASEISKLLKDNFPPLTTS